MIACVDGGSGGLAAARVAGALARWLGLRLVLATVEQTPSRTPVCADLGPDLRHGRSLLHRTARELDQFSEIHVAIGEPAERLLELAERDAAEIIVIAVPDHRRTGTPQLGSVYLALAGAGPCPVVVLPPGVDRIASIGPIVCGVDGSESSTAAVRAAAYLAGRLDTRLLLVHAAEEPATSAMGAPHRAARGTLRDMAATIMKDTAEALRQAAPNLLLEHGPPAERLAEVAERRSAQLLVIGSRGRAPLASTLLGSVASDLATSATRPLMIVPANARLVPHAGGSGRTRASILSRGAPQR